MKYRPYWQRIIFFAIAFHVILLAFVSFILLPKNENIPPENLLEVEWIDAEFSEPAAPLQAEVVGDSENFPAFELPPLEIPTIEFPPLPEIPAPKPAPPPQEKPEKVQSPENPPVEEKPVEPQENKLKARVKVFPKDLISQLVESGAMPERIPLNVDKIVLSLTIATDGKTKDIEIKRGGGNLINLIARSAASAWVFEPFLDESGNPVEIKTELEFVPEDF